MRRMRRCLAALLLVCLCLSGCGELADAETTTIRVDGKGAVTEAVVEPYGESDEYTQEELKTFVEEDVASFNESAGSEAVKLLECRIKKETVRIRLRYSDASAYAAYHGLVFFVGTIADAKAAGFTLAGPYVDTEGKAYSADPEDKKLRVVICQEPVRIETKGDIVAVSANVEIVEKRAADASGDASPANQEFVALTNSPVCVFYRV